MADGSRERGEEEALGSRTESEPEEMQRVERASKCHQRMWRAARPALGQQLRWDAGRQAGKEGQRGRYVG